MHRATGTSSHTHTSTPRLAIASDVGMSTARTGDGLHVDPSSLDSPVEFVAGLRLLRVIAGKPSFQTIARRSGRPRSTMADVIRRGRTTLPSLELSTAFVRASSPDTPLSPWTDAWKRLSARLLVDPDADSTVGH